MVGGAAQLSDYLWGIETTQFIWCAWWSIRFQTTYEELKPQIKSLSTERLFIGFQTTYEELKQSRVFEELRTLFRFQTTYEELKQAKIQPIGNVVTAFRLPMRNWNIDIDSKPWNGYHVSELSDYLWGIETSRLARVCARFSAFRLPMRNWNKIA